MTKTPPELAYEEACDAISGAIINATAKIKELLDKDWIGYALDTTDLLAKLASSLAELRGSEADDPVKSSFAADE